MNPEDLLADETAVLGRKPRCPAATDMSYRTTFGISASAHTPEGRFSTADRRPELPEGPARNSGWEWLGLGFKHSELLVSQRVRSQLQRLPDQAPAPRRGHNSRDNRACVSIPRPCRAWPRFCIHTHTGSEA